ncbi:TlpA family protein disulfide reductase [Sphingobacterium sp. SGR-19]|uniref:TlpA family protein disulfide reductase n=1 Tax=Sphingobacterium sp. SGR-19 TaxID=2710886 RepID=UPI0013EC3061|nr:TlpA disulfide reductase family protein [Sphingobacterium sp. SGR-19]NGM64176.1 TlpA family protein disulfide reductase [Sphingobacterium sp. SGR-19]
MKYFMIIGMLFACLTLRAQAIPSIMLNDLHDRSESSVDLRALSEKKLVLLDFWATWCGACLAAMPKVDSIAQENLDQVEVITITSENKETVLEFLEKRKSRGMYVHTSPKLFGDTLLSRLFPHRVIPHYVWLKEGRVIAVTEEVTREAVQLALTEGRTNLRNKIDKKIESFDRHNETLLGFLQKNADLNLIDIQNYSLATGYIERIGTSSGYSLNHIDNIDKTKFTGTNMALENLYRVAFGKMKRFINDSAIEVRSRSSYFATAGLKGMRFLDWLVDHGVSYEAVVSSKEDLFEKMISDLRVAFPMFHAHTVETTDTCLVLTEFDPNPRKLWKVVGEEEGRYRTDMDGIVIDNGTISGLMTALESTVFYGAKQPLVDKTGYTGKISVHLLGSIRSLDEINAALKPYGLRLEKKMAIYDKLIIEDRDRSR